MNLSRVSPLIRSGLSLFRSFSGSPIVTVGLKTLLLARKAPLTLLTLGGLGFGYSKYQGLKKEVTDKLEPLSKALEWMGVKNPQKKEEGPEEKVIKAFRSILAADPIDDADPFTTLLPAMNDLQKLTTPHIIDWIEKKQEEIALPQKETTSPPTEIDNSKKSIFGTFSKFLKVGEARIAHELEIEKERLKKESGK
ncbi:MAG: hypothetical protein V4489_02280 [Chlamydiota bacterium]